MLAIKIFLKHITIKEKKNKMKINSSWNEIPMKKMKQRHGYLNKLGNSVICWTCVYSIIYTQAMLHT